MFDSVLMELFEVDTILPSLFDLRNFVGCLLCYVLRVYAGWHFHYLERIWLHEDCVGVATDLLACQLLATDYTVRSCFEVTS